MIVSNGKVKIELRKSTIRDGWLRAQIVERLREIDGDQKRELSHNIFARVVSQAATIEGLEFPLPNEHDDDTAIKAAWERWTTTIDEDYEDQLLVALNKLIKPIDEILGPTPPPEYTPKN